MLFRSDGVEVVTRISEADSKPVYCIFNCHEEPAELTFLSACDNLLSGGRIEGVCRMEAKETLVVAEI